MPATLPQPRLADAHRVTKYLMVGGALSNGYGDPAAVLRELTAQGLTHILDCRSETSDARLVARVAPEVVYARVGTADTVHTTDDWFTAGVGFARIALADPSAVLLTHCSLGQTRGPSMGFAVLLDEGYEPGTAFRLITTARPQARIGYADAALNWYLNRIEADSLTRAQAAESLRTARAERFGRRHFGWR
ncbi:MAG: hypothetical protein ACOYEV_07570 [Candidatus Nanopelagicales bacterium]